MDGVSQTIVGVLQKDVGPLERDVAFFTPARWPAPSARARSLRRCIGRLRPDVPQAAALDALRATNRAALSDLEVFVSGREGNLGPAWISSRASSVTWASTLLRRAGGGRLRAPHRLRQCRQPADCARAGSQPRARDQGRARRAADQAAPVSDGRKRAADGAGARDRRWRRAALSLDLVTATAAVTSRASMRCGCRRLSSVWLAALAAGSGLSDSRWAAFCRRCTTPGQAWIAPSSRRPFDARTGREPDAGAGRLSRHSSRSRRRSSSRPCSVLVSLARLSRVDVGIDTSRMLTAGVSLSGRAIAMRRAARRSGNVSLERVAALPGVEAAALADSRPPREAGQTNNFDLEDHPTPPGRISRSHLGRRVAGVFSGRRLAARARAICLIEHSLEEDVMVVDRAWAERFFPGQEVLGRRLKERRLHVLPVDDSGRRRRNREVGWPRSYGDRHGLLSVRRPSQRVRRLAHRG